MSAPSIIKYSTSSEWSNIEAQCSGVIFWMSVQNKLILFSCGCILNISWTMAKAPWALIARQICKLKVMDWRKFASPCQVNWGGQIVLLRRNFGSGFQTKLCRIEWEINFAFSKLVHTSTALISPPWTAEWSGTFPSESKNEIISSRVHPRDSPHCYEKYLLIFLFNL